MVRIVWNRAGEFTPAFPSSNAGQFVKGAVPGAPKTGFPLATSTTAVSLPYGPPDTIGGDRLRSYTFRATSSGGTIEKSLTLTITSSHGDYNFTGLTAGVEYTFSVAAVNNIGTGPFATYSTTVAPNRRGENVYEAGSFVWQAPTGVTSVSVVVVGGGGGADRNRDSGGGGGGLAYANNISVSQYRQYNVVVGAQGVRGSGGNPGTPGGTSYFLNTSTVRATGGAGGSGSGSIAVAGGVYANGGGGGNGGAGYNGAGGAGGYGGNGGVGQRPLNSGTSGTNGAGAGGSNRSVGGSVGLFGRGNNGAYPSGSGSVDQGSTAAYGGGGASWSNNASGGAVRIVYPGSSRQFPTTDVGAS